MDSMIIFLLLLYTPGVTSTYHSHVTEAWKTVPNRATTAWKTVLNQAATATTKSFKPCSDTIQNCADYASITCQGEFIQWARQHCRASCGFCNAFKQSTTQINQTKHFKQETSHTTHLIVQTTSRPTVHTKAHTSLPIVQTTAHTMRPTVQTKAHISNPIVHTKAHAHVHIHGHIHGHVHHHSLQTTVHIHSSHPIIKTTAPTRGCQLLDIVFLLDASATVGNSGLQKELNIAETVIQRLLKRSITSPKFGVVLYTNNKVEYHIKLNKSGVSVILSNSKLSLIGGIGGVDRAIHFVHVHAFSDQNGGRPHAKKVLVVMGNGQERHFSKFINLSKDANIDVYFIGVGDKVVPQRLQEVAIDPIHQIVTSPGQLDRMLLSKFHMC